MNENSLPYYEQAICAQLSFIKPFGTDWSTVSLQKLNELFDYLTQQWISFRESIIEDVRGNFSALDCVIEIFRSLRKYTRSFIGWKDMIKENMHSSDADVSRKAQAAYHIFNRIEIIWIPFLLRSYPPLIPFSKPQPEFLSAKERMDERNKDKEEWQREIALRSLLSIISGRDINEKKLKFDILYKYLIRGKGKNTALYLQAALELGWLLEKPEYNSVVEFWKIDGVQGAYSKLMGEPGESLLKENVLEQAKIDLQNELRI